MMSRCCFYLLACATLSACAYSPATRTDRLDIRQVPYTPDSGSIAIRCGKLIDGFADTPQDNVLVVIRDGRIKSMKPGASRGDATATYVPVLDLSGYTCLPGLIDMHTHLTDRPEDTADLTVYFSRPPEETLRQSTENAAATLLAGFTSVRNVGTYVLGADTALRDQINAGKSIGPRMQASGPYLTIPKGGGDLYIPDFKEPADNARFHAGVARDPEGFRERAEFLIDNGSDLLKVIASGAVLAFGGVPGEPEMTRADIDAVVDIAHAVGKKVAAHAHGAESILMAIAAGVDTIEHASYLDDAGIRAARRRGDVALAMDVYNGDYIDTEGRTAQLARGIPAQEHRDHGNPAPGFHQGPGSRRSHRVRDRRRRVPARTQRAPVSHHGGARHDADAGHPVGDGTGLALHGLGQGRGHDRGGKVWRCHRREGRSAERHQRAAERRGGGEGRIAVQERWSAHASVLKNCSYSRGIAGIERISMSR